MIKVFLKNLATTVLVISLAVVVLGLTGPIAVLAATTPSLGVAGTYGVLADTYTNTVAGTTINGDVGFTTGPAVAPLGSHPNYGSGAPYALAGIAQNNALGVLASQPCTFTFAPGPVNLSTDTTHGPIGVYTPGVYCSTDAMTVGGPLTLSGSGTFIFRPIGALDSTAGAVVTLAGASACDVFWTAGAATTLGANTTFVGNIMDVAGITMGANSTLSGRALAFGGTITTDTNTITVPTCTVPPTPVLTPLPISSHNNNVTVFKQVINNDGGTAKYSDFPLFVNGNPVASGQSVGLTPGTYTVTETGSSKYKTTFAGNCDVNGKIIHGGLNTYNSICTVVNDDIGTAVAPIPPLIHITKIPDPIILTAGPGSVTYNFAVSNVGVVPITDVTVTDDKCSSVNYLAGDLNLDSKLDINEIWSYSCVATLTQTTKNTVTATGKANGLTSTDMADATVVVGSPIVPPLIDLVKVPTPLFLPSAGGLVKYVYLVNNPGVVALSNVTLVDDKCSQVVGPVGDTNGDGKLDTNETWNYSCEMTLSTTMTNIGTAKGSANGFEVSHSSEVTVVVAVPKLPNTGFGDGASRSMAIFSGALALVSIFLAIVLKRYAIK